MAFIDQKTFIQLTKGSSNAFERLYVAYKSRAVGFCYSILKNQEEAENIVQDVFAQLWERRERLDEDTNFEAYLFSCLKNKVFDYLKALKRNQSAIEELWDHIEKIQTEKVETEEEKKLSQLFRAIDNLPSGRKQILQMRYLEGDSYQAIADQLSISRNTVKNQLMKARQYLKENIDISTSFSVSLLIDSWLSL